METITVTALVQPSSSPEINFSPSFWTGLRAPFNELFDAEFMGTALGAVVLSIPLLFVCIIGGLLVCLAVGFTISWAADNTPTWTDAREAAASVRARAAADAALRSTFSTHLGPLVFGVVGSIICLTISFISWHKDWSAVDAALSAACRAPSSTILAILLYAAEVMYNMVMVYVFLATWIICCFAIYGLGHGASRLVVPRTHLADLIFDAHEEMKELRKQREDDF
ncbi:hypothetical protein GGR56DRAFT_674686 [Xylariaceae sp. FL0804]|nr:hypothetical protein GGR56DRAFT_674686 [Xylariaceae sp. FL0804]